MDFIMLAQMVTNVIPLLIEAGIEVNAQDNDGRNGLRHALIYMHYYDLICVLVDVGCALSEEDLEHVTVQHVLEANAEQREDAESAMVEADFPQRAARSVLDSDFPQIRTAILDFLFLPPRES